jgi:hypothetical protein
LKISARINQKMITKLRRLKLLLHLEDLWTGPGKVFRRTLPQSSSDFIYAIIVEDMAL